MAEVLRTAQLAISDCAEFEEMDFDRDAALTPSTGLANENHNATARSLDVLERLLGQVCPPVPELLHERNHLRNAPEMLRSIRVGPPVTPDVLDIGMQEVRELFA